jgi:hypothetical protein
MTMCELLSFFFFVLLGRLYLSVGLLHTCLALYQETK